MSVVATATFKGDTFEIEITDDGELIFLNHDINYDLAMMEFGEKLTTAVKIRNSWMLFPPQTIFEYIIDINKNKEFIYRLLADYVDHPMCIYENTINEGDINEHDYDPRDTIKTIRLFLDGKKEYKDIAKAHAYSLTVAESLHWSPEAMAVFGTEDLSDFVLNTKEIINDKIKKKSTIRAITLAERAAKTIGMAAAPEYDLDDEEAPEDFHRAFDRECEWQVRRFVACMKALQAGMPWPPLEYTE